MKLSSSTDDESILPLQAREIFHSLFCTLPLSLLMIPLHSFLWLMWLFRWYTAHRSSLIRVKCTACSVLNDPDERVLEGCREWRVLAINLNFISICISDVFHQEVTITCKIKREISHSPILLFDFFFSKWMKRDALHFWYKLVEFGEKTNNNNFSF